MKKFNKILKIIHYLALFIFVIYFMMIGISYQASINGGYSPNYIGISAWPIWLLPGFIMFIMIINLSIEFSDSKLEKLELKGFRIISGYKKCPRCGNNRFILSDSEEQDKLLDDWFIVRCTECNNEQTLIIREGNRKNKEVYKKNGQKIKKRRYSLFWGI